jgi:hypothetical protein
MIYRFVLLFNLLFILPQFSSAQALFSKGQKSFYGGFWVNSSSNSGHKVVNFSLSPGMQIFLKPGLAVGGSVGLSGNMNADRKTGDFGKFENLSYGFGPSASYYYAQKVLANAYPFVHTNLQFHGAKDYLSQTVQPLRLASTSSIGALYMIGQHTGIQASYNYYMDNLGTSQRTTSSGFGTGFSVFF